jgi:hypothetical protein
MTVFHPWTRLDSYVEGALPPATQERITAHLAQCEACRREADQRERILQAATSLSSTSHRPAPGAGSPSPQPSGMTPVLEAREGVPGWKVVAGLGVLGLAALGVLSTAWIAGDPATMAGAERGDSHLLPVAAPATPSTGAQDGPGPSAGGPAEGSMPVAGTALLLPGIVSAAADARNGVMELTPAMVADLRSLGWNVPSLSMLGLGHEATGWRVADDSAAVVLSLHDDEHSLVLNECRFLSEDAPALTPTGCRAGVPGADGDATTGTGTPAGADTGTRAGTEAVQARHLPVGIEMSLVEHDDGSWTATTQTAQAAYTVESDLPVERADRVMSLVVISERSWVQAGSAPERPADRLARGFERLMPWTEDLEDDSE